MACRVLLVDRGRLTFLKEIQARKLEKPSACLKIRGHLHHWQDLQLFLWFYAVQSDEEEEKMEGEGVL
jgi:hypothetical protein